MNSVFVLSNTKKPLIEAKDGGDGIFKNGETGCPGQNREREMRCGSESLRNPSSSPGRSSSMTSNKEHL